MALYRRNKSKIWWTRFTAPNGQRIRQSTGIENRLKAQEFEDRLKTELWRVHKLGDKPRRTWEEAVVRWLKETSHKASHEDDKSHLRQLDRHLRGKYLEEVDRDTIDRITEVRQLDNVSNATVNRMLEVLRAVLRRACHEWEWTDKVPKVRMLQEPKRRIRWITREEADRLIKELSKSTRTQHLAEMVRFSLATGLREANVTGLEWSQVDMERCRAWIHPDQAKARKAIPVPLNDEAMRVLRRQIENGKPKHRTRVFTYGKEPPKPVRKAATKAWRVALERAGITDFRWHDLRHTWASWHVQEGTPLHALQELGGWETADMVKRYAHLSADHLSQYANQLAKPKSLQHVDTNLAQ